MQKEDYMTQQRRDGHSTEFGIWLRQQPEIDSAKGYVTINIDYVWLNYNTGEWMFIEEKRYGHQPKRYQRSIFKILHFVAKQDPKYRGFYLIVFENTSPDDGKIFINHKQATRQDLIDLLTFKRL